MATNIHFPTEVFIGREEVIRKLEDRFDLLKSQGIGHLVILAGEAGIGKTMAVNNFLQRISSGYNENKQSHDRRLTILSAKCSDISTAADPYSPFAEIFDSLAESEQKETAHVVKDWAIELGPKLVEGIIPYIGPLLGRAIEKILSKEGSRISREHLPPTTQTYQFIKLFEHLAKVSNLVVFIDDLHWADESSINLIFALAQRMSSSSMLLLSTYRPHELLARPGYPIHPLGKVLLEMKRFDDYDEEVLDRFTRAEVYAFLQAKFPKSHFSENAIALLYEKTDGNPFFLDQVIRLLQNNGIIYEDSDGNWKIAALDQFPIPKKVIAVVESRLGNLDVKSNSLLKYASVQGEQFRSSVLAQTLGQPHLSVLEDLRVLQDTHNLVNSKMEMNDRQTEALRPNWSFSHSIVWRALYESLNRDERREIHSLIVDSLYDILDVRHEDLANELAHHCEQAHRFAEAVKYRFVAAQKAYQSQSYASELIIHCSQAISDIKQLDMSPENIRSQVIFLTGLSHAYRRIIDLEKEHQVGKELLTLGREYKDPIAEIEGYLCLLHIAELQGERSRMEHASTSAWRVAIDSNRIQYMVRVVSFIATRCMIRQGFIPNDFAAHLDTTIERCQEGKVNILIAKGLQCKGLLYFVQKSDQSALDCINEAIKFAEESKTIDAEYREDFPFSIWAYFPEHTLTDCLEYTGRIFERNADWDNAIEQYKRVYERKESEKDLFGMSGLLTVIAEVQIKADRLEDAEQSFERSWAIAQATEGTLLQIEVISTGITIAIGLENPDKLKARLQLIDNLARDKGIRWVWHKIQLTKGIIEKLEGRFEQAEKWLLTGLNASEDEKEVGWSFQYNLEITKVYGAMKLYERAILHARKALEIAREHEYPDIGIASYGYAEAAKQVGKIDLAKSLLNDAITQFDRRNLPHRVAVAQEILASLEA